MQYAPLSSHFGVPMTAPRHEKAVELLRLAHRMQGTAEGVSLAEIETEFEVSRRTAERMRDAVLRIYPDFEELREDTCKRWRIPPEPSNRNDPLQFDELAALDIAAAWLRREGLEEHARAVGGAAAKARRLLPRATLRRHEVDLEALSLSEGLALRPGPRPEIPPGRIGDLRRAIIGCHRVRFTYEGRIRGDVTTRTVAPYGFLYGQRPYLVAHVADGDHPGFRLFSAAEISDLEVLKDSFARDPAFSLAAYAVRAFGAYQEDPHDVIWRISAAAAGEARAWLFHPTQVFEDQPDGSLVVRFHAGGLREMCWHLFSWRGEIEILAPQSLKDEMAEHLRLAAASLGG